MKITRDISGIGGSEPEGPQPHENAPATDSRNSSEASTKASAANNIGIETPSTGTSPVMVLSPGRRAALYGVLTAAALVCGYLELLIPVPTTIPGVKLGLGNAIVLIALERLGAKPGLYLMFAKVFASSLLFANLQMMAFSLAGGIASWAIMALAVRSGAFSPVATSVLGGIAHNAGQLLAVAALLSTQVALVNAPVLAVAGTLCGLAVGVVAQLVLRAIPQEAFYGRR